MYIDSQFSTEIWEESWHLYCYPQHHLEESDFLRACVAAYTLDSLILSSSSSFYTYTSVYDALQSDSMYVPKFHFFLIFLIYTYNFITK